MRPGSVKVETKGSYWWFHEPSREYLRLPKHEAPRERPEWGSEAAGALQDAVWHPYETWKLAPMPLLIEGECLLIDVGNPDGPIYAPYAKEASR